MMILTRCAMPLYISVRGVPFASTSWRENTNSVFRTPCYTLQTGDPPSESICLHVGKSINAHHVHERAVTHWNTVIGSFIKAKAVQQISGDSLPVHNLSTSVINFESCYQPSPRLGLVYWPSPFDFQNVLLISRISKRDSTLNAYLADSYHFLWFHNEFHLNGPCNPKNWENCDISTQRSIRILIISRESCA